MWEFKSMWRGELQGNKRHRKQGLLRCSHRAVHDSVGHTIAGERLHPEPMADVEETAAGPHPSTPVSANSTG
jgi:hypothetical protein